MCVDQDGYNFLIGLLTNDQIGHYVKGMKKVSDLLGLWPTRRDILEDVQACEADLQLVAVHRWHMRKSVPPKYWGALIAGAKRRGFALSADDLVLAHAPENQEAAQ